MWIKKHQDISHLSPRTDIELLRAEIAAIRAEVAAAKLEMAELSDKAYHMLQRTAKRFRDADEREQPAVEPTPQLVTDEVTERVLARRKGRGVSH